MGLVNIVNRLYRTLELFVHYARKKATGRDSKYRRPMFHQIKYHSFILYLSLSFYLNINIFSHKAQRLECSDHHLHN